MEGDIIWFFSYLIWFLGIGIVVDLVRKLSVHYKSKETKIKYLPSIAKDTNYYSDIILALIIFVPSIYYFINNIRFMAKIGAPINVLGALKSDALLCVVLFAIYLLVRIIWQLISGNVLILGDSFIILYSGRLNFGEINYVDVSKVKRILKRRKVEIYVNGKLNARFSISNKYTEDAVNIFKDKNVSVKIQ